MPQIYIFTGPTLSPSEANKILKAHYLPPVSQGDIYRIAQKGPLAIGIIDGFFQNIPSVWHKEILWALSKGIHVYGAASMGALRAAELEAFGMSGVGKIFEKYRDGEWEDDDEVAVIHGPQEFYFKASTEALANIRLTLQKAVKEGIINYPTLTRLVTLAKRQFYADRTYQHILSQASREYPDLPDLCHLRNWLQEHFIDQKKEDAIAMLQVMSRKFADGIPPEPKTVKFSFAYTEMFDQGIRSAVNPSHHELANPDKEMNDLILDELRLDHTNFDKFFQQAAARILMVEETYRLGLQVTNSMRQKAVEQLGSWLDIPNGNLERKGLEEFPNPNPNKQAPALLEETARYLWMENLFRKEITSRLPGYLKSVGAYPTYFYRASMKYAWLESTGNINPSFLDHNLNKELVLQWHFRDNLKSEVPNDLKSFIFSLGINDPEEFFQILLREYIFQTQGK